MTHRPQPALFAGSFWYDDITAAPLDPDSPAKVAQIVAGVAAWNGAACNIYTFNATAYNVDSTAIPSVDVAYDDAQHKGYEPTGLAQYLAQVPIPWQAVVNSDTDRSLSVYDRATDRLWEFWKVTKTAGADDQHPSWSAAYAGRIDNASTADGIFPSGWGASASGLPAGTMGLRAADVTAGVCAHAIPLELPVDRCYNHPGWPANRCDGWATDQTVYPTMGQRFRLDPTFDVSTLNVVAQVYAKAAQTHGFIVTDTTGRGGEVAVLAESPLPYTDATPTPEPDPWKQWVGSGMPVPGSYAVMRGFPWDRLQALPVDYGKPA